METEFGKEQGEISDQGGR